MTGIFKANNPFNTFLLLIYGLLLKLPVFLHPVIPQPQRIDGFLYKAFLKWLSPFGSTVPFIYSLLTFILLYAQAVSFNKLCNEQRLLQKPNYLVGMSYLLVTSLFSEWNVLSASLIINTILVWVWSQMSKLHNKQKPKVVLFNIGIAIGFSTFFYFPSIAFVALIIFGLLFTRAFNIAEWLIALLGIVTPYYFLLAIIFLTDQWKTYVFPGFVITYPRFVQNNWAYAAIIILLITVVIGLFFIQQNFKKQLIQTRKSWNLLFFYTIIAVFVPFINATSNFNYWILCAIPVSAFISSTFFYTKKWLSLALHWLIIIFVVLINYWV